MTLAACASHAPVATAPPPASPSLRSAVEAHLAAIPSRDLDGLLATITEHDELTLIFPDGEKLDTRQQYIDFHKQWFADGNWTFQAEIVDLVEAPDMGLALVRYRYDASNPDGSPRSNTSWLALTFRLENDGAWRLVFDQNTRIAPADSVPAGQE